MSNGVTKIFLVNTFLDKLVNVKTKPKFMENRLTVLKNLLSGINDSLEDVDVNFYVRNCFLRMENMQKL